MWCLLNLLLWYVTNRLLTSCAGVVHIACACLDIMLKIRFFMILPHVPVMYFVTIKPHEIMTVIANTDLRMSCVFATQYNDLHVSLMFSHVPQCSIERLPANVSMGKYNTRLLDMETYIISGLLIIF